MKGWLPPVALGAVVALLAISAMLALRPVGDASAAERADALASELRCPDCQGLSVADSPTRAANTIRRQIHDLVAQGASDDEVRAHFVARYGDWILLAPSSPAYWLIPFAVVLAAAAALTAWLLGQRAAPPGPPASVSDEDRRAVREEAEALDA